MSPRFALSLATALAGMSLLVVASGCSQPAPAVSAKPADDVVVFGDWRKDAPGVRHRITLADLPAPSQGTAAAPNVVAPPPGALPKVPAGFKVAAFVTGMDGPRAMTVAPNGDIFISEQSGSVHVLRAADGAPKPSQDADFADDLDQPFGIAFYPLGPDPQWVYVAENNRVVRFPYRNGDLEARGPAQVVIPQISPHTGGHWTRDIVFSADGKQLFVSVGSNANLAENMPRKTPDEIKAWEAAHGLGAAWDVNVNRANGWSRIPWAKGFTPSPPGCATARA